MCKFFSAIVKKNGDLIYNPFTHSHEDLIDESGLNDNGNEGFIRVEFCPEDEQNLDRIEKYILNVDENYTPDWFDSDMRERITDRLTFIVNKIIVKEDRKTIIGSVAVIGRGVKIGMIKASTIIILCENSSVETMCENSSVETMRENSSVKTMCENSSVKTMCENSSVETMRENSSVKTMCENSSVKTMWENSSVKTMRENSSVETMRENSSVKTMCENSSVKTMWENSSVETMCENSSVKTRNNS